MPNIFAIVSLAIGMLLPPMLIQVNTPAAGTPIPTTGDFAGQIDIGGRSLYLECHGEGSPTVILVTGHRDRDSWSADVLPPTTGRTMVLPGSAAFTRTCVYDRPGTVLDAHTVSRSDAVPQPQTAADAVADLHALLHAAAIPGPFVLVGHSYGGQIVRLYASVFPAEVAGLVLVDALPAVEQRLTAAEWEAYQQLLTSRPAELAAYQDLETVDFAASAIQVQEAAPLHPLPLVVLSRGLQPAFPPELPPGFSIAALEQAWTAGQADLVRLVPHARHVIATGSGHAIQVDQPELVVTAIRQVVDAVRDPGTWVEAGATPPA